jgi:hypothetical protein
LSKLPVNQFLLQSLVFAFLALTGNEIAGKRAIAAIEGYSKDHSIVRHEVIKECYG